MTHPIPNRESGQVMVILVLAFAILLGFAALAIDGGMLYSDRRTAQNAADAAALAGAGAAGHLLKNTYVNEWDCGSGFDYAIAQAEQAAVASADINQYTITHTLGITENTVSVTCSSGALADSFLDVRVRIDQQTPTTFAHLFFNGDLKNTVEATSRITPRVPFAGGNAIVSLTQNCGSHFDKGVVFGGNGDTDVTGGGIHSNSCLTLNGASGEIDVTGGAIEYDADDVYVNNGGMSVSPSPTVSSGQISLDEILQQCAATPNAPNSGDPSVLLPGTYKKIISINNNEDMTLRSGLYCLKNGIRINGGGILHSETLGADPEGGVTLVILNGDFDAAGNATVKLKAPSPSCDADPDSKNLTCPPAIPGMLIYLPPGSDGNIRIAGTSDSEYTGTVYAPDGFIDVGGSSSTLGEVWVQLIASSVLIHGDTTMSIHYDNELTFQWPAKLHMQR